MSEPVRYESADGIATVTINRAERLNALNEDVIQGLRAAWRHFAAGDDRVAVLCAAGYNIRWLLRMITKKGVPFLRRAFLRLIAAVRLIGRWLAQRRPTETSDANPAQLRLRAA